MASSSSLPSPSPIAPYRVELSPEKARALAEQGGTLLLLDVPAGTQLGLDQQGYRVGPQFSGVKMLPPGAHFLSYTAANSNPAHASVAPYPEAFFVHLAPGQVVVRKWDAQLEKLVPLNDPAEEERHVAAVRRFEFDARLGPYDLSRTKEWRTLSSYISPGLISRLEPIGGVISIASEPEPNSSRPRTLAEARLQEQLASRCTAAPAGQQQATTSGELSDVERMETDDEEKMETDDGSERAGGSGRCFYTHLPRRVTRKGATAAESTVLADVLRDRYGGDESMLLGELQFAFIGFLFGQSLEAFGQWKALLHLTLACFDAPLQSHSALFIKLLQVLRAQLHVALRGERARHGSEQSLSAFDIWLTETDDVEFLRVLLTNFMMAMRDAAVVPTALTAELSKLCKLLEATLGWNLSTPQMLEEDDEYAPVIVDAGELPEGYTAAH
eukprot:jgi/Chlat1/8469/Chrsp80S07878